MHTSCCASLYAAASPNCVCRVLPISLFSVDKNMSTAAMEVFYRTTQFTVRHDDLSSVLKWLPGTALPLIRYLGIIITPEQCFLWNGHGRTPTPAHPPWHLQQVAAVLFPPKDKSRVFKPRSRPSITPRKAFRKVLCDLAAARMTVELPGLDLTLDLGATYAFADIFIPEMNENDEDRFRWIYDFYLDVAKCVREILMKPGQYMVNSVRFRLGTFTDLEPWLEREVMGERFMGSVERPVEKGRARILAERVPRYHPRE
ncbi:hypothetical protein QBC47DRAFT_439369 [Echria macrotheca]|uniref:Uncharacterized protein n=1 Tax=Echria macrotheca TaxID=438768 RepID=A0AAJ0B6C8_9PEZI|nr:hypothetical protein QBC47DRAFT_439369 [Echria macrotheca]